MAQFQTLAECLQFIEHLKQYNIPVLGSVPQIVAPDKQNIGKE